MNTNKRSIHEFEMSSSYYEESWICGNKSHVVSELREMMNSISPIVAMRIINGIERKDIRDYIVERL